MKKVNVLVALALCAVHVPQAKFEVDEDAKTITGKVDSFVDETSPTPVKTTEFVAPILDGQVDEVSIDTYLQANIAAIIGGTIVQLPTLPVAPDAIV